MTGSTVHVEAPLADHKKAAKGKAGLVLFDAEIEADCARLCIRPSPCLTVSLAKDTSLPNFFPRRRGLCGEGAGMLSL